MQQTIAKVSWIQKIRRISAGIVWWATTLRIAGSVCSKTLFFLCQRCAAFEMDVWRHGLRIGPAHCGNNLVGWQEANRRSRSSSESEIISLGLGSRKDGSFAPHLGECGSETISHKSKGDLEHQRRGRHDRARVIVNKKVDRQFNGHPNKHSTLFITDPTLHL